MNKKFDLNHEWEVPNFYCIEFKRKNSKYALTIPVLNEGDRIRNQLLKIDTIFQGTLDIIIADGGSEDGSLDEFFLKEVGVRALLRTKVSQGLGFQLRMAYSWILNQNYQGIITVDGNDKDGMSAINQFIEKLDKGYDYIQGSRYLAGGRSENTPIDRRIGNRFIHAPLLSFFAKYKVSASLQILGKFKVDNRGNCSNILIRFIFVNGEEMPFNCAYNCFCLFL